MNRFLFITLFSFSTFFIQAQTYHFKITNLKINYQDKMINGEDVLLTMVKGKSENFVLFHNDEVNIKSNYVLKTFTSPRSSSKSSGVKIEASYFCYVGDHKDKRSTQLIMFMNNTGAFKVKETFIIKYNKKPLPIVVTYDAYILD